MCKLTIKEIQLKTAMEYKYLPTRESGNEKIANTHYAYGSP